MGKNMVTCDIRIIFSISLFLRGESYSTSIESVSSITLDITFSVQATSTLINV